MEHKVCAARRMRRKWQGAGTGMVRRGVGGRLEKSGIAWIAEALEEGTEGANMDATARN